MEKTLQRISHHKVTKARTELLTASARNSFLWYVMGFKIEAN